MSEWYKRHPELKPLVSDPLTGLVAAQVFRKLECHEPDRCFKKAHALALELDGSYGSFAEAFGYLEVLHPSDGELERWGTDLSEYLALLALAAIDRYNKAADPEQKLLLWQIASGSSLMSTACSTAKEHRSYMARVAARARGKSYDRRREAVQNHYAKNNKKWRSMSKAASDMTDTTIDGVYIAAEYRTVYDWIREANKKD